MSGDDLFAHKSKPIVKSASQSYVTKKREKKIFLSFELWDIREKYESLVHPRYGQELGLNLLVASWACLWRRQERDGSLRG